jgi:hypothetical protein
VQFKPIIALSNLKKESHNQKNILPEITFVKINPTKYKILIKDYKKPFYIIFSETFNNGWKLYLKNNLKNNDYEIFKNTSINSKDFFDYPSFFETSKLKKIPETQHLFANGYANAWFIATESFETNSDYEIILEYEPQKLLYLGLTITLITIIFTISFFIIYLIKKHSDIIRYNSK